MLNIFIIVCTSIDVKTVVNIKVFEEGPPAEAVQRRLSIVSTKTLES